MAVPHPDYDTVAQFVRDTVASLATKGVYISEYGNCNGWRSLIKKIEWDGLMAQPGGLLDFRVDVIIAARDDIVASGLWRPLKRASTRYGSSYGQKHVLENWRSEHRSIARGGYVANGNFIIAMMLVGYTPKWRIGRELQVNPVFNCSVRRPY
jgi:hypothetical protein